MTESTATAEELLKAAEASFAEGELEEELAAAPGATREEVIAARVIKLRKEMVIRGRPPAETARQMAEDETENRLNAAFRKAYPRTTKADLKAAAAETHQTPAYVEGYAVKVAERGSRFNLNDHLALQPKPPSK